MNNAHFKLECFKNGLYSPEQVIGFYNTIYKGNTKFNKRDAQLWMNGKSWGIYVIDQTAIEMINMLNKIRSELIADEKKRIEKNKPRYTKMFKAEVDLWEVHKELINLPLNFFHSILIEMNMFEVEYYGNLSILEDDKNEY